MGTEICKATPTHSQQQPLQYIELPQLTQQIQQYLKNNHPFEKQLEKAQHKNQTKSYPDGVYNGPVNIMNNPSGYGRLYKNDGSIYIGSFSNGKADGQGILIFKDGSYAKGRFNDNMFVKGSYVSQGFMYNGEFKNNLFHGQGEQTNLKDGSQFIGIYNQGRKVSGIMKWKQDKIEYIYDGNFNDQGQFVNGGKLVESSIGYYVGEYKNNKKHGKGTYQYENGIKYIGQYVQGTKQGPGILHNGDGSISYQGWFKNGLPHGIGKAYDKEGKAVEANWIEGINKQMISS